MSPASDPTNYANLRPQLLPLSREARRLSSFSVARRRRRRRRRPIELKQIASISGKLLPRRVSSYISVQSSINSGPFVSENYSSVPRWHSYGANTFGFYRYFNQRPLGSIMPYIIHGREGDSRIVATFNRKQRERDSTRMKVKL